jgi:hypothetical protein
MLHEGLVSLVEYILFALEENVFLGHSKPAMVTALIIIVEKKKILTCTQEI